MHNGSQGFWCFYGSFTHFLITCRASHASECDRCSDCALLEPPGALCGKVLQFELRAEMEASDSQVFSAEVELQMMDAPLLGELAVSASLVCD